MMHVLRFNIIILFRYFVVKIPIQVKHEGLNCIENTSVTTRYIYCSKSELQLLPS